MSKLAWMLLLTVPLISCATSGPAPSSRDFCLVSSPTYLDKADVLTPRTLRKILQDNETGAKLCGWKNP